MPFIGQREAVPCRWLDDDDVIRLYEVKEYESAGVWIESSGEPCLVVWASFEDGTDCMRLLYAGQLVKREKDVTAEGQWLILDVGSGEHLRDMTTHIKADGKAQGPILSEVCPTILCICRSQPGCAITPFVIATAGIGTNAGSVNSD